MKIGLVGYQGSGKSSLFAWLTGVAADPAQAHTGQSAMAQIDDPRLQLLASVYAPKKITSAAIELFDTPGLSRTHEQAASRLAAIRDLDALVLVVAAYGRAEPTSDMVRFDEDLLLADMEIVSGRIERLRESVKKPRPTRDAELAELATLDPLLAEMESGHALRELELSAEQKRATRAFQLLTEKPKLVVVNVDDDAADKNRLIETAGVQPTVTARLGLEGELSHMEKDEREDFERELGLPPDRRRLLLEALLEASGLIRYYTAGDKEVRCWLLPRGATALAAADAVHSDLARGFIRAETMTTEDLFRLGSEREVKAQNLMRSEPKDYVVADGDVLLIRFNV